MEEGASPARSTQRYVEDTPIRNRLLVAFILFSAPVSVQAQTPVQDVRAGDAALDQENWKSAETHFSRALKFSQSDPNIEADARHGRGVAELQLERWSAAKDDLSCAIELDPRDAGAFASRGMARKALGDYDGLLLDAAQAARLNPKDYAQFQEDAQSTVLYRRVLLGFALLAGILVCLGAVPLVRGLVRLTRAGG